MRTSTKTVTVAQNAMHSVEKVVRAMGGTISGKAAAGGVGYVTITIETTRGART